MRRILQFKHPTPAKKPSDEIKVHTETQATPIPKQTEEETTQPKLISNVELEKIHAKKRAHQAQKRKERLERKTARDAKISEENAVKLASEKKIQEEQEKKYQEKSNKIKSKKEKRKQKRQQTALPSMVSTDKKPDQPTTNTSVIAEKKTEEANITLYLTDEAKYIMNLLPHRRVYLVGGSVRQAYENEPYNDLDLVSDATPEEINALKAKHQLDIYKIDLGNGMLLYKLYINRIAIDIMINTHNKKQNDDEWLIEDAKQRDFTINALYLNRHSKLIDPLKTGIKDLIKRKIVPLNQSFDGSDQSKIQLLRAIHLSQTGDYIIPDEVWSQIKANIKLLNSISPSKLNVYMKKMFLNYHAYDNFKLMQEAGAIDVLFPSLAYKDTLWLLNQLYVTDDIPHPSLSAVYTNIIISSMKEPNLKEALKIVKENPIFSSYFATRKDYEKNIEKAIAYYNKCNNRKLQKPTESIYQQSTQVLFNASKATTIIKPTQTVTCLKPGNVL